MPQHDPIDDFTRFVKMEVRKEGLKKDVWGRTGVYLHLLFNYPNASMPHFTMAERMDALILHAEYKEWLAQQGE